MKREKEGDLSVVLASPLGTVHEVDERSLGLLPATGLETAVRVDEEERVGEDVKHGLEAVLDLLSSGNTRRVNVVDTGANLVGVAVVLEGVEKLHVGLGGLDGDDIGVETLDGGEDVVEVGVAEVRMGLELIGDASSRELEGVNGPLEIGIPVRAAKGETLTDGGLVDLDGTNAGLLEVNDLVAEGKSELLALNLPGDISTREGPVKDGDGSGKHALHGLLGQALSVRRPLDGHGMGTADIRHDDGGTNITRYKDR